MTEKEILDAGVINTALGKYRDKVDITLLESVDSTNTYAKKIADGSLRLVVSEYQTSGRGRLGRSFFSPSGKGIYMSLVIPVEKDKSPVVCTVIAAVAAAGVIDCISDSDAKIKWVNDIFSDGKKVCGILCEGIIDEKSGTVSQVVVGIGMNLYSQKEDFPEEISKIAASVFPKEASRSEVTGMIASRFLTLFYEKDTEAILKEYKDRLFILGKKISYTKNCVEYEGVAVDVNEEGNLIVTTDNGTDILSSGEISLRSDSFTE